MNFCTSLEVAFGDRSGIDLFLLLAVFDHHRGPPSFAVLPLAGFNHHTTFPLSLKTVTLTLSALGPSDNTIAVKRKEAGRGA